MRRCELLHDGKTLDGKGRPKDGTGVGLCSCGAVSPKLPSTGARKRWHTEHRKR